uniref:Abhydrolase_3 domain-containing protein n=1 Tax=Rhabditophanes sp. KR3021 TaxID=114890 RepID=A0AC35TY54_9BILA
MFLLLGIVAYFVVKLLLKIGVIDGKKYIMIAVSFLFVTLPGYFKAKDSDYASELRKNRIPERAPKEQDFDIYSITTKVIGNCPCRIYKPKKVSNDLLFIYFHGGGWVECHPGFYDHLMEKFIDELNCTIVSIDYPLAPEDIFPVGVNESYNTIANLMGSLTEIIGFETKNVMVGGDSSGGGLTANMTQRAALNNKDWFRYQLLLYPALGSLNFQSQSYKEYHKTKLKSVLSPEYFARPFLTYLGIKVTKENIKELINCDSVLPKLSKDSPLAPFVNNLDLSPILADEQLLKKLPSSITFLAHADILTDEGFDYHMNMKKASIKNASILHEFHWIKNSTHGEYTFNRGAAGYEMVKEVKYFLDKVNALNN